ncbi:MAG: glycosyltransferase family 4 protein [Chloroflexota bacterium]
MARRIHVLFLSAGGGMGADTAVHVSLARVLDRSQVRVSAATRLSEARGGASAPEGFEGIPDLTILPLEFGQTLLRQRGLGRATTLVRNVRGITSLVSLVRWCRANEVDLIHVTERPRQMLLGLLLARMAGCACVVHAHTSYNPDDATALANWSLRHADAVVGVSHFTTSTYRDRANLSPGRVFTVHNGVDGQIFRPEPASRDRIAMRDRLGLPPDVPVIGCVARLMRWKGQAILLEAFVLVREIHPQARLVLAGLAMDSSPDGRGDYRDYLMRRIAALGLGDAVTLPGYLPRSEMPQFYAALDVLAHPAIEEPFGLAVVEAMACSRPVVAANGGGIPEIIRDGVDGLLVPVNQPEPMAKAISRVFGDPSFTRQLATTAREHVLETFTPEIQAAEMLMVYRQVMKRTSASRLRGQPTLTHAPTVRPFR